MGNKLSTEYNFYFGQKPSWFLSVDVSNHHNLYRLQNNTYNWNNWEQFLHRLASVIGLLWRRYEIMAERNTNGQKKTLDFVRTEFLLTKLDQRLGVLKKNFHCFYTKDRLTDKSSIIFVELLRIRHYLDCKMILYKVILISIMTYDIQLWRNVWR